MIFKMKWSQFLRERLLGQKLDVEQINGEVFARYDSIEIVITEKNKLGIRLMQGHHKLVESDLVSINPAPGAETSVSLTGLEGRFKLVLE